MFPARRSRLRRAVAGDQLGANEAALVRAEEAREGRYSFAGAFERARESVAAQEQAGNHQPSQPQMFLGSAMREKLRALEARLALQAGSGGSPAPR